MQENYDAQMQTIQIQWSEQFSGQGNCNWPQLLWVFTKDLIQLFTSRVSPKGEQLEVSVHSCLQALERLLWRLESSSVWETGCKGPHSSFELCSLCCAKWRWGRVRNPRQNITWKTQAITHILWAKHNQNTSGSRCELCAMLYLLRFVFLKA